MTLKSKQLFILIGDDRTGKTTLQKLLIDRVCGFGYDRLPTNRVFNIIHPEIKRKYQNISFGNRSYQEKLGDYLSVENYFQNHFEPADIAFISSHLVLADIQQMIVNGRNLFYNLNGIFWSNSIESNNLANAQISALEWNERFVITNPHADDEQQIHRQLELIADNIVTLIINRTSIS
jgi:hypothetical protein